MDAGPTYLVRETRLSRSMRLMVRGGGATLLGLMPFAYFRYAPRSEGPTAIFYDLTFGILAVSILIYLVQLLRRTDIVASVAPEGLCFAYKKPGGLCELVSCGWSELRAIEVLRVKRWAPIPARTICIRLRNDHSFADFPLKGIPQSISDEFINALRQYWPDLDAPWEAQLAKRKAMDSSAR